MEQLERLTRKFVEPKINTMNILSATVNALLENKHSFSITRTSASEEVSSILLTVPSALEIEHAITKLRRLQNSLYSTTWQVLHKIDGQHMTFLEKPSWTVRDGNKTKFNLKGNLLVGDEHAYLQHRPELAFVVYKHYSHQHQTEELLDAQARGLPIPEPAFYKESISLLSEPIKAAVNTFVAAQPTAKNRLSRMGLWRPHTVPVSLLVLLSH